MQADVDRIVRVFRIRDVIIARSLAEEVWSAYSQEQGKEWYELPFSDVALFNLVSDLVKERS